MYSIRDIHQQNKNAYKQLECIQSGGNKKWMMYSDKQRKSIIKTFNEIAESDKSYKKYPLKKLQFALSGMDNKLEEFHKRSKQYLYDEIKKTYEDGDDPIIHEDSLTAWCNQATEKYGLTVGDIKKMKFSETMELIMFDRNMGEHVNEDLMKNNRYDPTKTGCVYTTYIHGSSECFTGLLKFHDIDVVHSPFNWEINLAAVKSPCGHDWFFGPLTGCDFCKNERIDPKNLDDRILLGWRGPCIRKSDAKNLPKYVVHYNNWWNDCVPLRYHDYLKRR